MAQTTIPSFPLTAYSPSFTIPGQIVYGGLGVGTPSFLNPNSAYPNPFSSGQLVKVVNVAGYEFPVYDAVLAADVAAPQNYAVLMYNQQQQYFSPTTDPRSGNISVLPISSGGQITMLAAIAINMADQIYWDTTTQKVTNVFATATTTPRIGFATQAAAANTVFAVQLSALQAL